MTALPIKTAYQGDTVQLDFDLVEPDGSPLDLDTADEITWSLSDPTDLDTAILTKDTGDGISVLNADTGSCRVTVPAGALDTPGTYTHEIEATFGSITYTYGQGMLIVKPTVMPT
jgi:hypothetical protein